MTDQIVTLMVSERAYEHAQQIAHATEQPIEQVLQRRLEASLSLPSLSPDEEAELSALNLLSDDALWTIAAEQMPATAQNRLQALMDKNTFGTITPDEYAVLKALVERGDRLMLRKAEAAAVLTRRGHTVNSQHLTAPDG